MWDIPQLYIYIYVYIIEVIMDWDATPSKLCWRWFLTPTMELFAIKKQRFLMNLSFRSKPSEPSLARLANHWDACRHLLFRKHSQSQYCLYIYYQCNCCYRIIVIVVIVIIIVVILLPITIIMDMYARDCKIYSRSRLSRDYRIYIYRYGSTPIIPYFLE